MQKYRKVSNAEMEMIRKSALKNPTLSWTDFLKAHPKFKASQYSYNRYRHKTLVDAGIKEQSPTANKKHKEKSLYTKVWNYSVAEFDKDPLGSLADFLQSLTNKGRANFELIKIEKQIEGKWVPHLEIRES